MQEVIDLFNQALAFFKGWGQLSSALKIAGILTLVIGVWKMSFLQPLWDKLGAFKALVAPVLMVGITLATVHPFTWTNLVAAFTVGLGSKVLADLFTALRQMPFIKPWMNPALDFIGKILFKPKSQALPQV